MAIGTLRCFVIDVEDLEVGAAFWSEVTGIPRLPLPEIASGWTDHAYLGYQDEKTWKHEIILHRVPTAKRSDRGAIDVARRLDPAANRAHIDIGVEDVDRAIERIEAIGGRLKYPPSVYPVPHAYDGARPLIDWAVMQDPFGTSSASSGGSHAPSARPWRSLRSGALPRTRTGAPSPAPHATATEKPSSLDASVAWRPTRGVRE